MTLTLVETAPPITAWPDGTYRIGSTKVLLEAFIWVYTHEHKTAEQLVDEWPVVTLQQAHAVLAYYLANKDEVDAYVEAQRLKNERLREEDALRLPEPLREKLRSLLKQKA